MNESNDLKKLTYEISEILHNLLKSEEQETKFILLICQRSKDDTALTGMTSNIVYEQDVFSIIESFIKEYNKEKKT